MTMTDEQRSESGRTERRKSRRARGRSRGAIDIERAEGVWRDGTWADFDPLRTPRLVR